MKKQVDASSYTTPRDTTNGRTLRCHGGIDDDNLVRLIRLVEAA